MRDEDRIVRERQRTIRGQLDKRGISLKVVAYDSGIPYPTVCSYFTNEKDKEPATVGGAAMFMLCGGFDGRPALPLDLLSLLLPDGLQIVRAPEDLDHDRLCELAAEYVAEKNRAHHPDSEAGRDIGPGEAGRLNGMVVQLRAA